jgi:hypothetical protein
VSCLSILILCPSSASSASPASISVFTTLDNLLVQVSTVYYPPLWRQSLSTSRQLRCLLSQHLLSTVRESLSMLIYTNEPSTILLCFSMVPSSAWEHLHRTKVFGHRYHKTTPHSHHMSTVVTTAHSKTAIGLLEGSTATMTPLRKYTLRTYEKTLLISFADLYPSRTSKH